MAGVGSAAKTGQVGQVVSTPKAPALDGYASGLINNIVTKTKELKKLEAEAATKPGDQNIAMQIAGARAALGGIVQQLTDHTVKSGETAIQNNNYDKARGVMQTFQQMQAVFAPLKQLGVDDRSLQNLSSAVSSLNTTLINADYAAKSPAQALPSVTAAQTPAKGTFAQKDGLTAAQVARENLARAQAAQPPKAGPDPTAQMAVFEYQLDQQLKAANGDQPKMDAALAEYALKLKPVMESQGVTAAHVDQMVEVKKGVASGEISQEEALVKLNEIAQEIVATKTSKASKSPQGEVDLPESKVDKHLNGDGPAPTISDIKDKNVQNQLRKQEEALEQQRIISFLTAMMQQRHDALMAIIRSMGGGRG
jgi:hypothetical protein